VRVCQQRPIQSSGWAFQLQRPVPLWAELQAESVWASIVLAVFCTMMFVSAAPFYALPLLAGAVSHAGVALDRPDCAHRDADADVFRVIDLVAVQPPS
jgi:hypothetical protein